MINRKQLFELDIDISNTRSCLLGLSNILTTFQEYINKIWTEKLDIFIIIYLDNILIYTKDPGQLYIEAIN